MEIKDVIIIGSGQGGVPLATHFADQGLDVAIFEKSSWGGSCINYGCTPSKAFLASAHAAHNVLKAGDLGIDAEYTIHFPKIMDRVRGIIQGWSGGVKERLSHPHIERIEAAAHFTGKRTVTGDEKTISADRVIINTGKSPFIPPIPGLKGAPYLTYESFWELEEQPRKMIVVGGGYTGVELGQGMARLGTEVHILERNPRIIHREEEEVSNVITRALKEDGVAFHFQSEVSGVQYSSGTYTVEHSDGSPLQGDALLVATGRKPNTKKLDPAQSQIETDEKGHIIVDDQFQTSCQGIYAIGDVTGQPAFTHVSWEDYRRLSSIFEGKERSRSDKPLVYAFFTQPQVGRVGLTLDAARKKGYKAQAETLPLDQVARALEVDRTRGFYRLVIDRETDNILGATLVGEEAAELVHIILAHMEHRGTWHDLDKSMHIHPAYAEALPTLARKFHA